MPIYSYKCLKGHKFSQVSRKFKDSLDDYVYCPQCARVSQRQVGESMKGTTHKWAGRILEWGKPDIIVDREEDLLVEGQKPMTVIEG
ncbi:hypothetical protein LCGC14_1750230 [marine sediment metagenome]|uniref:Putative regulatory protein FmdB zinc ribbon domain-containing protein n=1 Tax=marine sediment metagenome TaxID=412755 RepID=A0A0F9HRF8_9ZZZZ